jgi:hypothetical protein
MTITVCLMELRIIICYRNDLEAAYGLSLDPFDIDDEEVKEGRTLIGYFRRFLKGRSKKGKAVFEVNLYYSYPTYEQYLRFVYAVLVINSFLKVLNVAQFS